MCVMAELREQQAAALQRLRKLASPLNYEAFCRRCLDGQNNNEVAIALGLSPKAAQRRYEPRGADMGDVDGRIGRD